MKKMELQPRNRIRGRKDTGERNDYPGYQPYPPDEDIFTKNKQESSIDPEDIAGDRTYPKTGVSQEIETDHDVAAVDLDVPGSELDDELESVGSEDEENNYYSITDDNFDDLEDILDR
jgi:hypothetical protein